MIYLLEETSILGSKPVDISYMSVGQGEVLEDPWRYKHLDGKLNYLTVTRLDISFTTSVV